MNGSMKELLGELLNDFFPRERYAVKITFQNFGIQLEKKMLCFKKLQH